MPYDYNRARTTCDKQIRRFGGASATTAKLVRNDVKRSCVAARLEYTPRERGLYEDKSSRILISALSVSEVDAPDNELDMIEYGGDLYRILRPVEGFRQGAGTILFYDCNVMWVAKL